MNFFVLTPDPELGVGAFFSTFGGGGGGGGAVCVTGFFSIAAGVAGVGLVCAVPALDLVA